MPLVGPNYLGRHGWASFLADQNLPPAVAMAILGHANISTTMEIYTHALPKSMREAAEAIERALTPGGVGEQSRLRESLGGSTSSPALTTHLSYKPECGSGN